MYRGQLRFGVRGGFPDKPQIEDSSEISALNVLQIWMSITRRESRNVHRPAVCIQLQHEFGISKLPNTLLRHQLRPKATHHHWFPL